MDGEGGWQGEAFSVYKEDSHSGCSMYFMPPKSQLLWSQESCVGSGTIEDNVRMVKHKSTLSMSKPTARKAEFHILLLHSKVEAHSFGNGFVKRL